CNLTVSNPSGQFVSPNYPKEIANYNSCGWTLSDNSNIYYVVSIPEICIENVIVWRIDELIINIRGTVTNTSICNTGDNSTYIFASSGKYMYFFFSTRHSPARRFSGSYRSYEYNTTITESKFGYIASPG
ncbi:unnamed protein product, partial [Lymnaea stagnalis]